ncbi:MAG TPA: transcription elongation factor GreA [bacterium]|jgi:transcription elongation factor GreA|nr:transcription elongation factor GreA [bacterium]
MNQKEKDNKLSLTPEGLQKIRDELKDLIENKRPEVAKRIQNARDAGDISENSEYDAAKQEQSYVEGRIAELEDIIKNSRVSEVKTNDMVGVGCKVTLHMESSEDTFYIVGAPEADPLANKISYESPLGSALLGKRVGEKVEFEAPVGKLIYTITKIEY